MSPWWLILIAAALEVAWASGLKATEGFTKPLPTALTVGAMAVSMILLARAAQHLPIGTAYAVWVGLGAAGTVLAGAWFWSEPLDARRVFWLSLLITSIIGLQLTERAAETGPPAAPGSPSETADPF